MCRAAVAGFTGLVDSGSTLIRSCQLGPKHLDRNPATVPDVLGQVDGGHSAAAELALEHVTIQQSIG